MRIRQFIAALMVLLSLSAQARSAFTCAMMPGATLAHLCCPAEGQDQCPADPSGACCDQAAPADAALVHIITGGSGKYQKPAGPIELPPVAALESRLLPASFDAGRRRCLSPQAAASRHRVRPLYLQTARLRL